MPVVPVPDKLLGDGNEIDSFPSISLRRINFTQVEPVSFLTLNIIVNDTNITSLLDTGARVSLMKRSLAIQLNLDIDVNMRTNIYGIGGKDHKVVTFGITQTDLMISTLNFKNVKFHVVPDDCMDHSVFIGMDFLQDNDLVVNLYRQRIKHCDRKTGAQWELYIFTNGYRLVYSYLVVRAAKRVVCNSDLQSLFRVPVNIDRPFAVTSFTPVGDDMYYYEGKIGKQFNKRLYGVPGIVDMQNPFVLMQSSGSGIRTIEVGEKIGTISTIISVEDSGSFPVNIANREEFNQDTLKNNLDLGQQLTVEQKDEVINLLNEHRSVISQGDDDVGRIDVGSFEIKLYDYTPIYHRPRRFPDPIANEIEQECEKLRAQDIIEPSLSPYNCRVLPIRKGDGTLRLCMDYRDLNAKTIPDRFPMTNLMDSIFSLHGYQYFTTIDLVRGYYQMEVEPESREFTAFSTSRGHWQYKRMPFGLKNAPASFQRAMQNILKYFPQSKVIVYLDDILIIEKDFL